MHKVHCASIGVKKFDAQCARQLAQQSAALGTDLLQSRCEDQLVLFGAVMRCDERAGCCKNLLERGRVYFEQTSTCDQKRVDGLDL